MSITIHCDRCGASRDVKDKYAGLKVQCKSCGEFVRVGGGVDIVDGIEVVDEPIEVSRRPARKVRPTRRHSGVSPILIIGIVGAMFLAIAGAIALAVYTFKSVRDKSLAQNGLNSSTPAPSPPPQVAPPGDMIITLNAIRTEAGNPNSGRQTFTIDYSFPTGPEFGQCYYLMIRTDDMIRNKERPKELMHFASQMGRQGTFGIESIAMFAHMGKVATPKIEAWVEVSKQGRRERVSNVVKN